MDQATPENLEPLLHELQCRMFQRRKAAADRLRQIGLRSEDYPEVNPGKLTEFNAAIQQAAVQAVDPAVLKHAIGLPRLIPGFIPLLVCLAAQILGLLPRSAWGALLWIAVTGFLLYWYMKCLLAGITAQTAPADRLIALGREIGLLKTGR